MMADANKKKPVVDNFQNQETTAASSGDNARLHNNDDNQNFFNGPTYWSGVASLSFLCTGLLRAYTSPALLSIQNEAPPNNNILSSSSSSSFHFGKKKDAISWIASSAPLASFLGTILSGPLLQHWGRKRTLILLSLVSTVGWVLVGNSWSISVLLLGRGLTGLASGLATATAPLYISEVVSGVKLKMTKSSAPASSSGGGGERRGLLPGVLLATGILLGFILAHQIQVWRKLALIIALFPGVLSLLSLTIPESPLWLSQSKSKSVDGEKNKFDLEMEPVVPPPPRSKRSSVSSSEKTGLIPRTHSSSNFSSYLRVGLLMLFQQWSGGNVLIYYLSEILTKNPIPPPPASNSQQHAGAGNAGLVPAEESTVHTASLIIALVQFIGFFLALPLIDHPRVGRRFLLLLSSVSMMLAHLFLGFHFHHMMRIIGPEKNATANEPQANYFNDNSSSSYYDFVIRVSSLAALLSCYSIGLGPIPFLFIERSSSNNGNNSNGLSDSSYLSSFASLVNHLALFLAVKAFPYLFHMDQEDNSYQARGSSSEEQLIVMFYQPGPDVTFWLFAGVCWITAVFTYFCIPVDTSKNNNQSSSSSSS